MHLKQIIQNKNGTWANEHIHDAEIVNCFFDLNLKNLTLELLSEGGMKSSLRFLSITDFHCEDIYTQNVILDIRSFDTNSILENVKNKNLSLFVRENEDKSNLIKKITSEQLKYVVITPSVGSFISCLCLNYELLQDC
jgi:hypothetical protein